MRTLLFSTLFSLSLLSAEVTTTKNPSLPTMSLKDTQGKTYQVQGTEQGLKIAGMEGKVVFLEFFGHQCPPCLASIPHLINLKNKYKDKLAIIAIEVQGYTPEKVETFVKEKGMNYIVASESNAAELVRYIQQRAQWRGSIPFLVVMDKKGAVQFVQAGMLPEETLEKLVDELSVVKNKETNKTSKSPTPAPTKP